MPCRKRKWLIGSPPHARGRLKDFANGGRDFRITPACAGKTQFLGRRQGRGEDHPRMRGEDRIYYVKCSGFAWITPACAGKTNGLDSNFALPRDHPRMRGEDLIAPFGRTLSRGSPPHARGRRHPIHLRNTKRGITPACAGKTRSGPHRPRGQPDHPRMRGEDG